MVLKIASVKKSATFANVALWSVVSLRKYKLEIDIPLPVVDGNDLIGDFGFQALVVHLVDQLFNEIFSLLFGFRCGEIFEILVKGEEGVRHAILFDQAGFGQIHKVLAHASVAVASGAKRRDEAGCG